MARPRPAVLIGLVLFSALAASAAAQESDPLPVAAEFTAKLGWTPAEALAWMGAPESLFPYRGAAEREDTVAFFYPDRLYLFWFRDRVWQVRADERWDGEVDGVRMGMDLEEVISLWGPPINDVDPQPTWTLPDRGYPVRIRLYFDEDGRLSDLYVYRSDW